MEASSRLANAVEAGASFGAPTWDRIIPVKTVVRQEELNDDTEGRHDMKDGTTVVAK